MKLPPHQGKTARKRHEQVRRLLHPFSAEIMDNLDKERPIVADWKFYENSFGTVLQMIVLSFVVYWLVSGSISAALEPGFFEKGAKWGVLTFLTIAAGISWYALSRFLRSPLSKFVGVEPKPLITVTQEGVTYGYDWKNSVTWGAVRDIRYGEFVNRGLVTQYADFIGEGDSTLLRVPMQWDFRKYLPASYDRSVHGSKEAITFLSFLSYHWIYWKCFARKN